MKKYKDCQPNYDVSQNEQLKTPFHTQLTARLMLDNLCYEWNKTYLIKQINHALDTSNEELFKKYSLKYKEFKNQ